MSKSVVMWVVCVLTSVKGMSSLSCVWPQQSVFSKQVEQCMSEFPPQSGSSRDCHSETEREREKERKRKRSM